MNKKQYTVPRIISIKLDTLSSLLQTSKDEDPRVRVYRRGRETQDDYEEDDTMW